MGIAYNASKDVFEFNFTSNSEACIVEFVDLPLEPVLLDDVEGMSNILMLFYALTNSKAKSFEVIKEIPRNIQSDSQEIQQHLNEIQTTEDKILILDDVSTTGATLKEIIKIVRFFNKKTDIILFTLIGKKSIV